MLPADGSRKFSVVEVIAAEKRFEGHYCKNGKITNDVTAVPFAAEVVKKTDSVQVFSNRVIGLAGRRVTKLFGACATHSPQQQPCRRQATRSSKARALASLSTPTSLLRCRSQALVSP
jgi:hypothetical protein